MEMVFSLLAVILLNEHLELLQILGAGLVLWGSILVQRRKKPTLDTTTNSTTDWGMERMRKTTTDWRMERIREVPEVYSGGVFRAFIRPGRPP